MDNEALARAQNRLKSSWADSDRRDQDAAILHLFEVREGRRFLWMLLQWGKFGTQPFTANALTTAFGCGELNVGNQLWARLMEVNPAGVLTMMQENADEQRTRSEQLTALERTEPGEQPST